MGGAFERHVGALVPADQAADRFEQPGFAITLDELVVSGLRRPSGSFTFRQMVAGYHSISSSPRHGGELRAGRVTRRPFPRLRIPSRKRERHGRRSLAYASGSDV